MTRIRFGARSIFKKKYEIDKFDFIKTKIDDFNVPYELDIWNNKQVKNHNVQIELRIEYFHFMYIPVLPTGKIWTLRKADGKLYDLSSAKYKIESRIEKNYYPLYTFTLPILIFLSISGYILSVYANFYYRNYKTNKAREEKVLVLEEKLDKVNPPFYFVIEQYKRPTKTFRRVDSIIDETYYLSKLPKKIDTFNTSTSDYIFYNSLMNNKLVRSKISKYSLDILISNNSGSGDKRLTNILTGDDFTK